MNEEKEILEALAQLQDSMTETLKELESLKTDCDELDQELENL